MISYRVELGRFPKAKIYPVVAYKETLKQVLVRRQWRNKRSGRFNYFDTWGAAREGIIEAIEYEIAGHLRDIEALKRELNKALELEPPKPEGE